MNADLVDSFKEFEKSHPVRRCRVCRLEPSLLEVVNHLLSSGRSLTQISNWLGTKNESVNTDSLHNHKKRGHTNGQTER